MNEKTTKQRGGKEKYKEIIERLLDEIDAAINKE